MAAPLSFLVRVSPLQRGSITDLETPDLCIRTPVRSSSVTLSGCCWRAPASHCPSGASGCAAEQTRAGDGGTDSRRFTTRTSQRCRRLLPDSLGSASCSDKDVTPVLLQSPSLSCSLVHSFECHHLQHAISWLPLSLEEGPSVWHFDRLHELIGGVPRGPASPGNTHAHFYRDSDGHSFREA